MKKMLVDRRLRRLSLISIGMYMSDSFEHSILKNTSNPFIVYNTAAAGGWGHPAFSEITNTSSLLGQSFNEYIAVR